MNSSQLIKWSLRKTEVERLILFLGSRGGASVSAGPQKAVAAARGLSTSGSFRGAVAARVADSLLRNCRPSPSDIHDPDRTRVHGRDDKGNPRDFYRAYTEAQAVRGKRRCGRGGGARGGARQGRLRSPQTWDSERVADYMGLWCDRLLLGDHQRPVRCAVLEPRVPAPLEGEAVLRAVQSHRRHLCRADVLLVTACADLPFGVLRQDQVELTDDDETGRESAAVQRERAATSFPSLPEALRGLPPSRRSGAAASASLCCSSLLIGVGDGAGPRGHFTAEEERRLKQCLLPLAAFSCALWAANPTRSASYAEEQTPTPDHLTARNANVRLWASMQAAMLSTRDTALLRAYYNNELLDARLSQQQQTYLAETLLCRLEENDVQRRIPPPTA